MKAGADPPEEGCGYVAQFPFSAIVAMDDMRLALILNAISPAIGGVLVRGEKGTAKSTAVRALTAVLPPVEVVDGCRFSCDPASPDPRCPDGPHQDRPAAHQRNAERVEIAGADDVGHRPAAAQYPVDREQQRQEV